MRRKDSKIRDGRKRERESRRFIIVFINRLAPLELSIENRDSQTVYGPHKRIYLVFSNLGRWNPSTSRTKRRILCSQKFWYVKTITSLGPITHRLPTGLSFLFLRSILKKPDAKVPSYRLSFVPFSR